MNTLTLDVSKNTLKISATGSMTSGNEGYLQVSLILDADWAGAAIYPAYVVGGTEYSDYPATAIAGTTFIIPTAIGQSDGIIRLGLIGVVDSVIMRTNYVFIPLLIGAATGTAVPLPTPAALEALVVTANAIDGKVNTAVNTANAAAADASSAVQIAQGVRDDADAGVFKGDKGDKGDTGAQGPIGNVMYATFDIDFDTGELMMTTPDGYTGPTFLINDETGELEVSI